MKSLKTGLIRIFSCWSLLFVLVFPSFVVLCKMAVMRLFKTAPHEGGT
jgi:hypothetical protein